MLNKNKLIDLSADFRLNKAREYFKWYKIKHKAIKNIKKSIYALPELKGSKIKNYSIINQKYIDKDLQNYLIKEFILI